MHAGDEVELYRLPHEGDRLSAHPYVKDIYGKTGRNGNLAFYVHRVDYKDQRGQLIGSHDTHLVYPEESGEQRRGHAAGRQEAQPAEYPPAMAAAKPLDLARVDFEDIRVGDQAPAKFIRITVPIAVRWELQCRLRRGRCQHP